MLTLLAPPSFAQISSPTANQKDHFQAKACVLYPEPSHRLSVFPPLDAHKEGAEGERDGRSRGACRLKLFDCSFWQGDCVNAAFQ